jgi:chromosome segregation and condensation protein ScpB
VLAFIDEKNPSMKDLKSMFGRKVMGWITKLIERGLVERRGGYHNCNFYRTNLVQLETA